MRIHRKVRSGGATVTESALVYPVTFVLTLGLVVGAMGVFRYQQVATLARETARYASVHGQQYARENNTTAPTPAQIYTAVVPNMAVGLDLTQMTYTFTYNDSNNTYHAVTVNNTVTAVGNTVKVKLSYNWIPEALLGGVTLTSTSEMPMTY